MLEYFIFYFIRHHDKGIMTSAYCAQAKVCELVAHDYKKIAYMKFM